MSDSRTCRVLIVTDTADPSPSLEDAIRERADRSEVQFRLVVLNPARAELHLLHPERHDKATEAERVLRSALPRLELAAHAPIIGSVSVRHDPMDAIEEIVFGEPVDEIVLDVPTHPLSSRFHQDLEHRLAHLGTPVSSLPREHRDHPTAT